MKKSGQNLGKAYGILRILAHIYGYNRQAKLMAKVG
jgi:hypothetical protein